MDSQLLHAMRERYGETMTISDCARELGIKAKSLRNKVYEGNCPVRTFRIGNRLCANTADVAQYVDDARASA